MSICRETRKRTAQLPAYEEEKSWLCVHDSSNYWGIWWKRPRPPGGRYEGERPTDTAPAEVCLGNSERQGESF